jgi:hypothetical protein
MFLFILLLNWLTIKSYHFILPLSNSKLLSNLKLYSLLPENKKTNNSSPPIIQYRKKLYDGKDHTLPDNYTDPVSIETIKKHFKNIKLLKILENRGISSEFKLFLLTNESIIIKPTDILPPNLTIGLEQ